jgi:DNA helicase HerA-like ATPase
MSSTKNVTNFYKLIKPVKIRNPNYEKHKIRILPARILILGQTGAGKTNEFLKLLSMFSEGKGTFLNLTIYCRNRHEPLYDFLSEKIPETEFIEVTNADDIKPLEEVEDKTLVVFDDLITLMSDKKIAAVVNEYMIRSRKVGVTIIFLSQNYYNIPKLTRQQFTYIIFKRINSNRDLAFILKEFPLDVSLEDLKKAYTDTSKGIENSLMIDLHDSKVYKNYELMNK